MSDTYIDYGPDISRLESKVKELTEETERLNDHQQELDKYNYYVTSSEEDLVNNEILACERAIEKMKNKIMNETNKTAISIYSKYVDDLINELEKLKAWKNGDKTVELSAFKKRQELLNEKIEIRDNERQIDFQKVDESVNSIREMTDVEKNNKNATKSGIKKGLLNGLFISTFVGAPLGAIISASIGEMKGNIENLTSTLIKGGLVGAALSAAIGLVIGINETHNYKKQKEKEYHESVSYLNNRGLLGTEELAMEKGRTL